MLVAALGCAGQARGAEDDVGVAVEALRTAEFSFDVKLRETGSSTISAVEYTDRRRPRGQTLLAIPGLIETGPTYEPLARAVFEDRQLRRQVGRIIAISLPGRGESPFPTGLPAGTQFGTLLIDDNASVIVQAIAALRERGTPAQIIVGHSMGGLAITAAQALLQSKDSSLRALGIERAVLIAPVPPHAQPWTPPPPSDLSQFVVQDPVQGAYLALSDEAWIGQGYTTRAGKLVSNAPTPAQVKERGYNGFEPLLTLSQLLETPFTLPDGSMQTIARPSVPAGAFAAERGTQLSVLSFSEDILVQPTDLEPLYVHLTGDAGKSGYHAVVADDAVHSMFVSNPEGLLDAALD